MQASEGLIYLCKQAVDEQTPDREMIASIDLEALRQLASEHMLGAITAMALEKAGIKDPGFRKFIDVSYYKTVLVQAEKDRIFQRLREKKIWHMALKGAVIKDWYPRVGMRECVDLDILFDPQYETEVKDVMLALGYQVESYGGGHHDIYIKSSGMTVEMHLALFGVEFEERLNQYFRNAASRIIMDDDFEGHFNTEDFYVYFIAHGHNHYVESGIGLRFLVDEYVFLNKFEAQMDWKYVQDELGKIEVDNFENSIRLLVKKIFSETAQLSHEESDILNYILGAGSQGSLANKVNNRLSRGGGGLKGYVKYFYHRIVLPMDVVEHSFSFFYRHKLFLPFLPFYRAVKGIINNRNRLSAEVAALTNKNRGRHRGKKGN